MNNSIKKQEIIIRPQTKLAPFNIRELLKYRHMIWSMIWRDIRLQFNDMYLGFFWAVSRPLAMVTVFTFLKRASGANACVNISYPLYVYSGIILWFYFLEATMSTSKSVNKDIGLIKKIYFPRMITPIVPVVSSIYTLGIAIIPLVIIMIWQGVYPGWQIVLLPFILVQCMILCLGTGTIFASLSLINNDFDKFLNLVLYIGLFVSPVIFSPDILSSRTQVVYFLNPMAGTLLAFRACFFYNFPFPVWQFVYSVFFSIIFLFIGTTMFRKAEIYFVDKI